MDDAGRRGERRLIGELLQFEIGGGLGDIDALDLVQRAHAIVAAQTVTALQGLELIRTRTYGCQARLDTVQRRIDIVDTRGGNGSDIGTNVRGQVRQHFERVVGRGTVHVRAGHVDLDDSPFGHRAQNHSGVTQVGAGRVIGGIRLTDTRQRIAGEQRSAEARRVGQCEELATQAVDFDGECFAVVRTECTVDRGNAEISSAPQNLGAALQGIVRFGEPAGSVVGVSVELLVSGDARAKAQCRRRSTR